MCQRGYEDTHCVDPDIIVTHRNGTETWEIPASANTKYLSHSYFRYIGQFPPQIARALIHKFSEPGETLIDPMCGGGTSLLEGRLAGLNAIGIDLNPVAILWSKVKSSYIETEKLAPTIEGHLQEVRQGLKSQSSNLDSFLDEYKSFQIRDRVKLPDLHGNESFFDESTLSQLGVIQHLIKQIGDDDCRDFALSALLAIIRKVSLANKKKMNVVIDEKSKKYPVLPTYEKQLRHMVSVNQKMKGAFGNTDLTLQTGDVLTTSFPHRTVDLAIIHPPYPTNTSFAESLRLQLAFMDVDYKKLTKKEVQVRGSYFHKPTKAQGYLIEWHKILKKIHEVLRPEGFCGVVIGDGRIEYVRLPMGAITCEFAADLGFSVEHFIQHILVNNTGWTLNRRMDKDYVIILKKVA